MRSSISALGASLFALILSATPFVMGAASNSNPITQGLSHGLSPSLLRASLTALQSADSLGAWEENALNPEALAGHAATIGETPLALRTTCDALEALSDSELAHFEILLASLPCSDSLTVRTELFWESEARRFENAVGTQNQSTTKGLSERKEYVDSDSTPIFTRGDLRDQELALTFDDGPHPTRSLRILKSLQVYGVHATYFMVGKNANAYPAITKTIADDGQSVGSHSWSHQQLPKISSVNARTEIRSGHDAVERVTGIKMPFFRFPYGARTPGLQSYVQEQGLSTYFWNFDSLDWKLKDPVVLYERLLSLLQKERGGISLFHDIHEQTAIVIPRFLKELADRSFVHVQFVPREP